MRYSLTLDLKDDEHLINEYETYHQAVWPEILASIRAAGITSLEIYRYHTRLFMIMDVDDSFSFERKNKLDEENPVVQKWEELMWNYQQAIPGTKPGEKWVLMNKIFSL